VTLGKVRHLLDLTSFPRPLQFMQDESQREELLLQEVAGGRVVSGGLVVGHGGGILATQELLGPDSPLKHLFQTKGASISLVMDIFDESLAQLMDLDYIQQMTDRLTGGVARNHLPLVSLGGWESLFIWNL
jgi:hypothetical protein